MNDEKLSALRRYGVAVLAVLAALALDLLLWSWARPTTFPLFTAAVLLASWHGGLGPGLLATALSALAGRYFFIAPYHRLALDAGVFFRLAMFTCVAAAASYMTAARRRSDRARREAENRHRLLLENVRDHAIFMMDPRGYIASWDVGAERLLGYAEADVVGRPASVLFTPEDARDGVPGHELDRARAEGRAEDERWQVRKDGSRFFASVVVNSMRDEAGALRGFAEVMRDITPRRRAEEERARLLDSEREARREAEEARRRAEAIRAEVQAASLAKDRFLAMVSHELRNPLTPVLLTATALADDPGTPDDQRRAWEMVRQNVGLEARLIDDLLDFARAITGKMPCQLEVVDAHELIRRALDIVRGEAEAKGLRLDISLGAGASRVNADPTRLTQALWNIARNAVKFTDRGGTVSVRTRDQGGRLLIEVTDTGIGIEPGALGKVFNAFEQVEDAVTRQYGGLGLGLAITRSIVEAHGGTVSASSPGKGRGATFTIALETTTAERRPPETPPTADPGRRPCNILLVEDDQVTCRVMGALLRGAGYAVTTATSYDAALAVASPEFDLVVSDVGLPGRSGLELMRELKRRHGLKGIALTGFGLDADVRESREAGFDAHLTKPIDFPKLEAAIRRVAG